MSGGGLWGILLASLVALGPGPGPGARGEPPPPRLDELPDEARPDEADEPRPTPGASEAAPEGPAPPPASSREEDEEPPGIEFAPVEPGDAGGDEDAWAVPPPRGAGEEGAPEGEGTGASAEQWPDPGTAPGDGSGAFMAGALVLAGAPPWSYLLLRNPGLSREDRTAILVAGGGLGAIGLGFLGFGAARQVKLRRWALAYRVQPTRQGGALLVFGGVAQSLGLTGVPIGIYWLTQGNTGWGAVATAVGAASLGLAPLCLHYGRLRRAAYLDSGGWVRRPLPQVQIAPQVMISRDGFGLGLAGHF